ncbi:MAG: SCP2 sterol-binding domain-containing protein [Actinomycetota bacterium]|nr:SCP2 sterol-binding domain-containing protein [Actinomycetota bacterium]
MGTAGNASPDESGAVFYQSQEERNKALTRRFVEEIINGGDLGQVVDELFHEEYLEGNYPLDNRTGPEIVRTWIPYLRWVYPDVRHEILDIVAEGNTVICRSIQFGTPRGFLEGKSKGVSVADRMQKRMELNMLRVKDGKFCEHWGPFSRRLDEKDPQQDTGDGINGLPRAMERAHKAWAAEREAQAATPLSVPPTQATGGKDMATIQGAFDDMAQQLASAPDRAEGLTATYQYHIEGEHGGLWILAFDQGHAKITPGKADKPDVTISVDEADMLALSSGELSGVEAFMTGKLRVEGDPVLGMRLGGILGDP